MNQLEDVNKRHMWGMSFHLDIGSGYRVSVNKYSIIIFIFILFLATKCQFVDNWDLAEPILNSYCDFVSYRILTEIFR